MEGCIEGIHLGVGHVVGDDEGFLADGADEGEGGVEYDGCFGRTVDVLVGVADGDGANGGGEASPHAADGEGNGDEEGEGVGEVVFGFMMGDMGILGVDGDDLGFDVEKDEES